MLVLRKIVFYFFVIIYLILCPLTILYALGYLFRPGTGEGIVKTGLIDLSTAPPGASVYIGKSRYTEKTPTTLRSLLPGEYPVKLILKHHIPWTQTVPVEAEKATVLEKILLLPTAFKHEELLSGPFQDLIPLPGNHFFLLVQGPDLEDLYVYDWKEQKGRPLLSSDSPFQGAKVLSHMTVEESPALLVRVELKRGEKFLWVTLSNEETVIEDLTSLFPEKPLWIEWEGRDRNQLFVFQRGSLNRLEIVSKAIYPKIVSSVRGYGLANKAIYVLRNDNTFERVDQAGKGTERFPQNPSLSDSLSSVRGFLKIKSLSSDTFLFWGERGELLLNRPPYQFVRSGVTGFEIFPQTGRLLLWQKNRLGILDVSEERQREEKIQEGQEPLWIFRKGDKIEQAFWVYDGSHILFRDREGVFLIELETYGKPKLYALLRVRKNSAIFYSEESGKLYFLSVEGDLSSVELLPREKILQFPFPERKEGKKKSEIQKL